MCSHVSVKHSKHSEIVLDINYYVSISNIMSYEQAISNMFDRL